MSITLAWAPSPLISRLEVSGPSHERFLQGLCSNDVVKLEVDRACEAFVPTIQGKILAHGFLVKQEDRIRFLGMGPQKDDLLPHLQKYAMIEDVEVTDRSGNSEAVLVWGSDAANWLKQTLGLEAAPQPLQVLSATAEGKPFDVFHTTLLGEPAYEISGEGVASLLSGFEACEEQLERLRIQNRFPRHGVDFGADHLGQEVNRDDQAISFTKGCYLGQETIARIDAMGHVNKKIVPVRWAGEGAPPGLPASIVVDGKEVGRLTSLAEIDSQWLGIAMLKRGMNAPGTQLETELGTIDVIA